MKKILMIAAVSIIGVVMGQAQVPLLEFTYNNNSYTNTGSLAGNGWNDNSGGISINGSGYTGLATDYAFKQASGGADGGQAWGSSQATGTNYPALDDLTGFTVMMWVKYPDTNANVADARLFAMEPAFGVGLQKGPSGFEYPQGAIFFDCGAYAYYYALTNLPVNITTNLNWQFICFRWDTNGIFKMNVGNKAGTLTSVINATGTLTTPMLWPHWNLRFGAGWYMGGYKNTLQDNCRFYGSNLTDSEVLAAYNADVAAGNVVVTTNVAPSTAGVAAAISYVATGDVTTNYLVEAANSLNPPVTWSTVKSQPGAGGATETYYEAIDATNKFFRVQSVH